MPSKNGKQGKAITVVVSLVMLVTFLGVAVSVAHRRNTAEAFLRDATALQLRSATLEQIQQLSARYDGHIEPSTCDPHGCAYFFSFDNGWLHRLRLAPYTQVACTLGSADGFLVYRRMALVTGNKSLDFGAFVEEWLSYPKGLQFLKKPFDVRLQTGGGAANIRWRVHVNLTADATPEQHRMAYSLNLRCLSKIGGCEDAQQMLPSISWVDTHTGYQLCRVGDARPCLPNATKACSNRGDFLLFLNLPNCRLRYFSLISAFRFSR